MLPNWLVERRPIFSSIESRKINYSIILIAWLSSRNLEKQSDLKVLVLNFIPELNLLEVSVSYLQINFGYAQISYTYELKMEMYVTLNTKT